MGNNLSAGKPKTNKQTKMPIGESREREGENDVLMKGTKTQMCSFPPVDNGSETKKISRKICSFLVKGICLDISRPYI